MKKSLLKILSIFLFYQTISTTSFIKLHPDQNNIFSQIFASDHAEIVLDGMKWPEGPVYSSKHQQLYWSDPITGIIRGQKNGKISILLTNSGDEIIDFDKNLLETDLAEPGSNGLAISKDQNTLYLCQHKTRRVISISINHDGSLNNDIKILADKFEGKQLNSPNDIIEHPLQEGRLFFTDPPYGLQEKSKFHDGVHLKEKQKLQYQGVYQIKKQGEAPQLIDNSIFRPNGIVVTKNGKYLWVAESCSGNFENTCKQGQANFYKYEISQNIDELVVKVQTLNLDFSMKAVGAADGLTIHEPTGWLISSCPMGLCIIDPDGKGNNGKAKIICHIKFGDKPTRISNVAIGKGENQQEFMYVTGLETLWRIQLAEQTLKFEL